MTQIAREEWKQKYVERIIETSTLSEATAEAIFEGGGAGKTIDFSQDPITAADEDLSYWCN